jgi:hypothetical protein
MCIDSSPLAPSASCAVKPTAGWQSAALVSKTDPRTREAGITRVICIVSGIAIDTRGADHDAI